MTTFIEQVQLPILCENHFNLGENRCHATADATVVALNTSDGRQDMVLYPVGWQAVPNEGFEGGEAVIGALCPKHTEVKS